MQIVIKANLNPKPNQNLVMIHSIVVAYVLFLALGPWRPVVSQLTPRLHQYDASNQHALRSGKEVEIHLQYRRVKSLYFQLSEPEQPVYILVSPCGIQSLVKWKLTRQLGSGSTEPSFMEELDSTTSLDIGDWSVTNTEGDTVETVFTRGSTSNGDTHHPQSHAPHQRQEVTLIREVGTGAMEYSEDIMGPGIYHLYMIALHNASTVHIFFSDKFHSQRDNFPELPKKPHLLLSNITTTSFRVAWVPSPSAPLIPRSLQDDHPLPEKQDFPQWQDIQYCLVLSRNIEFKSYCQLQSYQQTAGIGGIQSEDFSDKQEPDSGLNQLYHSSNPKKIDDRYKNNKFKNLDDSKTEPSGSSKFVHKTNTRQQQLDDPNKLEVNCVKYKNQYGFFNLEPNRKYHLAIFAVNQRTGRSVGYEGVSLVTEKEQSNKFKGQGITLLDGSMVASYLNPARNDFKIYRFPVKHFQKTVLIQVQPCAGYLRVRIAKDGRQIWRFTSESLRTHTLKNVKPGLIEIKVANDDHDAKIYKVWASTRKSKNPYPQLPIDTSIKVLEDSRQCRSIVLEWLVTDEKHIYCLYKKKEEDDYFKTLILEESDQCQGPSVRMKKVQCIKSALSGEKIKGTASGSRDPIMRTTVGGLEPGITYRFDLFASRPNRLPMSYRTVWVKTRKKCNS